MRLHYLQHVSFENPGSILEWAYQRGHTVTSTHLYREEELPGQRDFDWLVVMGGPMNIYQEDEYPWLIREKKFILESVECGKIVIGLCLGAQLIADVLGGKVTKNPCKEIGWFPVRLSCEAREFPLFSFFPPEPVVFEWHGDTFSIPSGAALIAENDACRNQAFMYGSRVFGFQFHLENTQEIIQSLIENCGEEMVPDVYVQTTGQILAQAGIIEQDNEWMRMFLSRLETMDAGRTV